MSRRSLAATILEDIGKAIAENRNKPEAGVTVVKSITQLAYTCPSCGERIIMDAYPSDVAGPFDGTLTGNCPECDADFGLFFEDEVS